MVGAEVRAGGSEGTGMLSLRSTVTIATYGRFFFLPLPLPRTFPLPFLPILSRRIGIPCLPANRRSPSSPGAAPPPSP